MNKYPKGHSQSGNHSSKYRNRHPDAYQASTEIVDGKKPSKNRENPVKDFQAAFFAEASNAELMPYKPENAQRFLNALHEAIMMKSTYSVLQSVNTKDEEFAAIVCKNLLRRVQGHHGGRTEGTEYDYLLATDDHGRVNTDKLNPVLKKAVSDFAQEYFKIQFPALKATLQGRGNGGR